MRGGNSGPLLARRGTPANSSAASLRARRTPREEPANAAAGPWASVKQGWTQDYLFETGGREVPGTHFCYGKKLALCARKEITQTQMSKKKPQMAKNRDPQGPPRGTWGADPRAPPWCNLLKKKSPGRSAEGERL